MKNSEKKLTIGIIGLGKMGILHTSILSTMPNVEIAALCDKSWLMRKLAKRAVNTSLVTDDLTKMSKAELDIVYVTTPIPSHYNIIKTVYSKNLARNVFAEKTLSLSYSQSQELCDLASKVNGVTMVGYMKRLSVTFRKAKELLEQNVLGHLLSFEAYAYSSDFAGVKEESASVARGGVLEDLGSHAADIALWFFGDLQVISAKWLSTVGSNSADKVGFQVEGEDDLKGVFNVSWIEEGYRMPEFGLMVYGSNGILKVDDNQLELSLSGSSSKKLYRQDLDDHVLFYLGESEYYKENNLFIRSILSGHKPEPSFQTATKVDKLLEQVRGKKNE